MATGETITISREEYNRFLKLQDEVEYLSHQLAEMKRLIFGSKRERFISSTDPQQITLFDLPEQQQADQQKETITYERKKAEGKKHPLRTELPAHLPRKEEVIEPENIPEGAKKIGEAVTELLDYTPATLHVRRIVRPKFLVNTNDEQTEIAIATLPSLPIPKGNADAGLLAYILISKFVDHLPFYRLVKIFKRQKVDIAESTIGGWFSATCRLLEPLYETLKKQIKSSNYLMADETPLPVLTKDKPGATHKGYHWVYYDPIKRLVLFDYRKSRGKEEPDNILKNFAGHLQTDGYDAYLHFEEKKEVTSLGCMAHARRYFDKAKGNDPERASRALKMFQGLYETERIIREQKLNYEQIRIVRQWISVPELKQMIDWFKEEIYNVPPQSAIGKAFGYSIKLWHRLERYVEDGRFQIDNNLIENSIRPVALGRKNYLFAGSHDAAQNAAMIYSLLATCKINDVEPFEWLRNVIAQISDHPANKLDELLPRQK
jgi:transposase